MFRPPTLCSVLLFALTSSCREPPPAPAAKAPEAALAAPTRPAIPVRWGVIEGQVQLSGTPPAPARSPTSGTVVTVCGEEAEDLSLVAGPGGALSGVVVSLGDGAALPPPEHPSPSPVLDQRRCAYTPPVLAARAGTALELRNSDPLVHNVRAGSATQRSLFNVAMPLEGMTLRRPLPAEPGTVTIRCDVHPWMRAVVRTFDHPYFATTGADGRFRLEVPEGTHTVALWHERLPEASRQVTVRAGETVRVDHAWGTQDLR